MKKLVLAAISLCGMAFSQNMELDPSFATVGISVIPTVWLPNSIAFNNGKYSFSDANSFRRINFDGSVDTSFGNMGLQTIAIAGQTVSLKGSYIREDALYGFGTTGTASNDNFLIVKLNESGALDSSFGNGGMVIIDLGQDEKFADLSFNADGTFFALGTQSAFDVSDRQMVLYKFLPDGSLDLSFNGTGSKFYMLYQHEQAVRIIPDNDDFFLAGLTNIPLSPGYAGYLLKVDAQGNELIDFGNNGSLVFNFNDYATVLNDVQISNGEVYFSYFWGTSFVSQGQKLKKFNFSSPTPIFEMSLPHTSPYFKVLDNGTFIVTGADRCVTSSCSRDFIFGRFYSDGSPDVSLAANGIRRFNVGANSSVDDASSVMFRHEDGRILIAGNTKKPLPPDFGAYQFAMIRLIELPLAISKFDGERPFEIFPNPVTTLLHIESHDLKNGDGFIVTDQTGKSVMRGHLPTGQIDVSCLTQGLYFLKIGDGRESRVFKLIKN